PGDLQAVGGVARDQVALARRRAADLVAGRVVDEQALDAVGPGQVAGDVGAEVVALDEVAAVGGQDQAVGREAVDDQAAHRAVAGRDDQAADVGARVAAVQFDQGRSGVTVLGGAVEDDRVGDGRQRRQRLDGLRSGAGNLNVDGVRPDVLVGV